MSSRYLVPMTPKSTGTAYAFWCLGFFGACGIHRLYAGKTGTGILWLLTFGLLGIGQLIDLFLIPGMVEDYNFKQAVLRSQGSQPSLEPPTQTTPASLPQEPLKGQALMREILRLAQQRQGILTLSEIAIDLPADFDEIEQALQELSRRGMAFPENNRITGAVEYQFVHLLPRSPDQPLI
ncbi:TM2 domain-containing protein [Synechococcus sp. Nb3U1]|uniref:TM2 domain-containing protein n=1 Tax=Synechococcus sp. Nb3U1 TaxID=1914529 RepID=UPI001F323EDA|nr:TM2 domain-containing protein [Synechococcus sp. Nb3U1]MCF2971721.1 TM2 domain-containing protein [Synechococcus sp. Nb3U1]